MRVQSSCALTLTLLCINEFTNISETTMARHLHRLQSIGILRPVWEGSHRKFEITELGREVAKLYVT